MVILLIAVLRSESDNTPSIIMGYNFSVANCKYYFYRQFKNEKRSLTRLLFDC